MTDPSILVDRDGELLREMRAYLDTLTIHGDNIGDIRRSLFMPFDSIWNGMVRDETAKRERPLGGDAAPAGASETQLERLRADLARMRAEHDHRGEVLRQALVRAETMQAQRDEARQALEQLKVKLLSKI